MSIDTITEHGKANRGTYMINLFGSIIPIIMFLVYASTVVSVLATEDEVNLLIRSHNSTDMHPAANKAVGEVQKQLDNILAFQIEERIEKQLIVVCRNPTLRNNLEPSIKQLIRSYNNVSELPYVRPTCAQLGTVI